MFGRISEKRFSEILNEKIRPARPIDTPELLQGRASKLKEIRRALNSPGMHVFIYGERGVGKTSLAVTAAKEFLRGVEPPCIGCDEAASFSDIVLDMCNEILKKPSIEKTNEAEHQTEVRLAILKVCAKESGVPGYRLPEKIDTVTQAANLLNEAAQLSTYDEPIIIIDEFDRITKAEIRTQFADLIKRIHDKRFKIRFLFCGIGKTLDELIGSHLSADRAIAPCELEPIPHDARWAIVNNASKALGISISREHLIRIGQISDGFPYYVHLISLYLFWEVFEHYNSSKNGTADDFRVAVSKAIEKTQSALKSSYEKAIQKTKNSVDYEEVLWSVAENTHLDRQMRDIYEKSYLKIMDQRNRAIGDKRKALDVDKFRNRLYNLCSERHGCILLKKNNGWYSFKENVLRGYVRLVADKNGLELGAESFLTS